VTNSNRRDTMFTKTSIALALIVAICSGASAADKRYQDGASAYGSSVLINRCVHGTWDAYGMRCDSGVE
jgi:hypothetical protein